MSERFEDCLAQSFAMLTEAVRTAFEEISNELRILFAKEDSSFQTRSRFTDGCRR